MAKRPLTPVTPEIQQVLDMWQDFAKKNNLMVNDKGISDLGFKAKVMLEYSGACICSPKERPICPCPQCIPECRSEKGQCNCHIFCSSEWYNSHHYWYESH
jgi:hypothetical protein